MSKGLGKTQLLVLERLKARGKALSALDIAGDIYYPEHECWDWQPPTEAKLVSVRRAIRSLAKAGLVKCGLTRTWKKGEYELYAWLAEQEPPRYLRKQDIDSASG